MYYFVIIIYKMKQRKLLLKGYIGAFALLGFYRGYIADYKMTYNNKIETIPYELVTDKFFSKMVRGMINSMFYITIGHGIACYKLFGRIEIYLTHKNPYDHKNFYTEIADFTTLKPDEIVKC